MLEERIAELGQRLRESEEARQKSVSPLFVERLRRFRLLRSARQRRRRLDPRLRPRASVSAVLQLRVGLPGRHPRDAGEHARRGRRPGRRARIDGAPLRRHQLGRRRHLHPQRDQPSPPLPAVGQRDHAREHQLRAAHRIGFHARRHRRRRPGRARVPAHERRQDVGVRGQDPSRVRDRIQGAAIRPALRHHAVDDRPLHRRVAARSQDPQQAARRLAGAGRLGHQRLVDDRDVPLLQRDRQEQLQDAERPRRGELPDRRACTAATIAWSSASPANMARPIAAPATPTRCGSSASICSSPASTTPSRRRSWRASRPGGSTRACGASISSWSGYVEFNWMVLPQFGFLVRGDMRDAIVTLGTDRLYLTKQRGSRPASASSSTPTRS